MIIFKADAKRPIAVETNQQLLANFRDTNPQKYSLYLVDPEV